MIQKSNLKFYTCRAAAQELGVSTTVVSILGRAQGWPGADSGRWRIPAAFVAELKTRIDTKGGLI